MNEIFDRLAEADAALSQRQALKLMPHPHVAGGRPMQQLREAQVESLWEYHQANPVRIPAAVSIPFATQPLNMYARTGHEPWSAPPEGVERIPPERFDFLKHVAEDMETGTGQAACDLVEDMWNRAFYHRLPAEARARVLKKSLAMPPSRVSSPRFTIDVGEFFPHNAAVMILGAALTPAREILQRTAEVRTKFPDHPLAYFLVTPLKVVFRREGPMLELWAYTEFAGAVRDSIEPTPALENIHIEL